MVKAYSYIRFSSKQQASGDSYRRQFELTKKACDKYNLQLDESVTFEDLGVSGFKGLNRTQGALGKFIQLVDEGKIEKGSWLIVESLDRLGREEITTAAANFLNLINQGITIYTCQDEMRYTATDDPSGTMGKLVYSIMVMSRAHEESITKSKRVSASWEAKRKLASQGGIATGMVPSWIELVDDNLTLIKEKAETVRKIFELTIQGVGTVAIEGMFNREGIPIIATKKTSTQWHKSYIEKIINSPATYGTLQLFRGRGEDRFAVGEPIEDYYPSAIDKATFLKAKQARASRRITGSSAGRKGKRFSNLLQGFVKCQCGGNMRYSDKGRGLVYLQCANKVSGRGDCKTPSYRYDYVESRLLFTVSNRFKDEVINEFTEQKDKSDIESQKLLIKDEIEDNQKKLDNVIEAIADVGNSSKLVQKYQKLEAQIQELEQELEQVETQEATPPLEQVRQLATKLLVKVAKGRGEYQERVQCNNLLRQLIDRLVFGNSDAHASKRPFGIKFKDSEDFDVLYAEKDTAEVMDRFIEDDTIMDDVITLSDAFPYFREHIKNKKKGSTKEGS